VIAGRQREGEEGSEGNVMAGKVPGGGEADTGGEGGEEGNMP
jgi:hypothetical protein